MGILIQQPQVITPPATTAIPDVALQEAAQEAEFVVAEEMVTELPQSPTAPEPVVDQARVEAVYEQAQEDGYAQGHQQGVSEGRKQGYERGQAEGYEKGLAEGEQAARQAWQQKITQIDEFIDALSQGRQQAVDQINDEFIPVVFGALGKIVGDLAVSPEFVQAAVRQALQNVRGSEQITIHVHPADLALLEDEGFQPILPSQVTLVADEAVTAGCLIETSCGEIDALLETQMARLKNLLIEMRNA